MDYETVDNEVAFDDVELLLAEHPVSPVEPPEDGEPFAEPDVAEVLAATWKEKRAELNGLQKSRTFGAGKDLNTSFRIEVEELKKRVLTHRCGKQGHWSRACRQPRNDGSWPCAGLKRL